MDFSFLMDTRYLNITNRGKQGGNNLSKFLANRSARSDDMSVETPDVLSLEKVPDSEGMRRLLAQHSCG